MSSDYKPVHLLKSRRMIFCDFIYFFTQNHVPKTVPKLKMVKVMECYLNAFYEIILVDQGFVELEQE